MSLCLVYLTFEHLRMPAECSDIVLGAQNFLARLRPILLICISAGVSAHHALNWTAITFWRITPSFSPHRWHSTGGLPPMLATSLLGYF